MTTPVVAIGPLVRQQFSQNGVPLVGGKLFSYAAGTTSKLATYIDTTGLVANTNPIILDANGQCDLFLDTSKNYKFVLSPATDTDPPTGPYWTRDNIPGGLSSSSITLPGGTTLASYFQNNVNIVVGSIAALRLVLKANNAVAFVTGYYNPHDGGGGNYQLDPTDLTSNDNGGSIIVAGDGGRWKLSFYDSLSVKQFGAKVDGATDDTAAANAADLVASTAKVKLTLPAGTMMANGAVGITRNGCSWVGGGSSISIVKSTASTYVNNTGMVTATGVNGFYTEGIGFDITNGIFPAGAGNPGNVMWAVAFVNCNQWEFVDCAVTGIQAHTIGLATNGCNDFTIENNYFNMPTPTGAQFNQAINISASSNPTARNRVVKNTMVGSALNSSGAPGLFSQNVVTGWGFGGGLTFGPNANQIELTITENVCNNSLAIIDINNTAISGIECWTAYTIIKGNICNGNSGHGITIGATQTICQGNICFNNGQGPQGGNGIIAYATTATTNASQCIVSDNNCFDNQSTKTQVYGYVENQQNGQTILFNMVHDNNFNGNKTGPMLLAASGATEQLSFRGPQLAISGVAANPGTLTAGATANQVVSINGAALGDIVKVGFSQDLQGVSLFGYVSAAGTVAVWFSNNNNVGSKTLTAGVINVLVEKPANYASLS